MSGLRWFRLRMLPSDERLKHAMVTLKERLPDHGKWSVLVPLAPSEEGVWEGAARGPKGEKVTLLYDEKTGLKLTRQGG